MEKFNSNLEQLLKQIKNLFPEQIEKINNHYQFDDNTKDSYLISFYNNCKTFGEDVSSKNEIIFSKENILLEEVDLYTVWNSDKLIDEYKENIWKYIHTMYILAYEYINDADVKNVLKHLKNLRASSEHIEHDSEILLNIVDSLTGKYTENNDENDEINIDENTDNNNAFQTPDIFNGMIGDLAKEIAGEIDTSKIDMDNPKKLLDDLLSGNFDEENDSSGITNLVKNITSKIQDKLASGTLDETQLFGEAQNVINSLGTGNMKSPMGDIFNTMMQSEMMNGMPSMPEDEKELFKNASDLLNKKNNNSSHSILNKLDKKKNRDRLKKKLEQKKKALADKEDYLKNHNSDNIEEICQEDEEDLEALAKEIEAIGNNKKETKKNKR